MKKVLFSLILQSVFTNANAEKLTQSQYDSYLMAYVTNSQDYQERLKEAKRNNHMPDMAKNGCALLKITQYINKISIENRNLRDAKEVEVESKKLINYMLEIFNKQGISEYRICNWSK